VTGETGQRTVRPRITQKVLRGTPATLHCIHLLRRTRPTRSDGGLRCAPPPCVFKSPHAPFERGGVDVPLYQRGIQGDLLPRLRSLDYRGISLIRRVDQARYHGARSPQPNRAAIHGAFACSAPER
jgi:hypothetical protein